MKLSSLLEESIPEHRQELSESKFLELLKEKARNSHTIAKQAPFFRQDKGADMQLVTPANREERSSFWVDKLIKEIPAWSKFPSRSRFIKAYTNYKRTFGGDDVYVLIPLDGAKIGVAPSYTFYRSFTDIQKSLGFEKIDNSAFASWVSTLLDGLAQITDSKVKDIKPETFSQLKRALAHVDEILQSDRELLKRNLSASGSLSGEQAKIIKDLLARHVTNTERYLEEKLDPEANGFQSIRIESFSKTTGDHEIWVDSPSLLIKRSAYIEMHKRKIL